MLTFTLILEHFCTTRPSCPLGAEHLCTQGEMEVFFLSTLKISLVQTLQEGPVQVMFALGSTYYENNVCSRRVMYPVSSVFGSHEPVAWCFAPFFQSGNNGDTNVTFGTTSVK